MNLNEVAFYGLMIAVMIFIAIFIFFLLKQIFASTPEEYAKADRITRFPRLVIYIAGTLALIYYIIIFIS